MRHAICGKVIEKLYDTLFVKVQSRSHVSVIESIKHVEFDEDQVEYDDDTDDDDAYVNDGHVAPLGQNEFDDDPGFFV